MKRNFWDIILLIFKILIITASVGVLLIFGGDMVAVKIGEWINGASGNLNEAAIIFAVGLIVVSITNIAALLVDVTGLLISVFVKGVSNKKKEVKIFAWGLLIPVLSEILFVLIGLICC